MAKLLLIVLLFTYQQCLSQSESAKIVISNSIIDTTFFLYYEKPSTIKSYTELVNIGILSRILVLESLNYYPFYLRDIRTGRLEESDYENMVFSIQRLSEIVRKITFNDQNLNVRLQQFIKDNFPKTYTDVNQIYNLKFIPLDTSLIINSMSKFSEETLAINFLYSLSLTENDRKYMYDYIYKNFMRFNHDPEILSLLFIYMPRTLSWSAEREFNSRHRSYWMNYRR